MQNKFDRDTVESELKDYFFEFGYPEGVGFIEDMSDEELFKYYDEYISCDSWEDENETENFGNTKEMVRHPDHYNREGGMECWDEMELIWGREAVIQWCLMTAYKYSYRANMKGKFEEDMRKHDEYMKKAEELKRESI